MDKLTIEHLAPYLPYGVSGVLLPQKGLVNLTGIFYDKFGLHEVQINNDGAYALTRFKPILRPLSDLTKEIEHKGKKFVPMKTLKNGGTDLNEVRFLDWKGYSCIDNEDHETCYNPETMSFNQFFRGDSRECRNQMEKMQLLFKWHFDVFGLIDAGLAIDINTIKT